MGASEMEQRLFQIRVLDSLAEIVAVLEDKSPDDRERYLGQVKKRLVGLATDLGKEAQLDNPTPEPAPACSCGECWWGAPIGMFADKAWNRKSGSCLSDIPSETGFGMSCPVCGDLLRLGGEVVRVVSVEAAVRYMQGFGHDPEPYAKFIADFDWEWRWGTIAKQPVGTTPTGGNEYDAALFASKQPIGGD